MQELLQNIDRIHTTPMGADRVRRNLGLTDSDVVAWCKNAIAHAESVDRAGKNWYVQFQGAEITVNAHSFTIITAHMHEST